MSYEQDVKVSNPNTPNPGAHHSPSANVGNYENIPGPRETDQAGWPAVVTADINQYNIPSSSNYRTTHTNPQVQGRTYENPHTQTVAVPKNKPRRKKKKRQPQTADNSDKQENIPDIVVAVTDISGANVNESFEKEPAHNYEEISTVVDPKKSKEYHAGYNQPMADKEYTGVAPQTSKGKQSASDEYRQALTDDFFRGSKSSGYEVPANVVKRPDNIYEVPNVRRNTGDNSPQENTGPSGEEEQISEMTV